MGPSVARGACFSWAAFASVKCMNICGRVTSERKVRKVAEEDE